MKEVDTTLGSDETPWDADMNAASSADSPTPGSRDRERDVELSAGDSVGRYQIVEVLGSGGMGVVYRAYDPQLDRHVALKLLRATRSGDRATTRMLREAQSAAKIRHPNVITVHDAGEVDGRVFIAMELMRGTDLGKWFEARQPWDEVVRVMLQAAEGLQAAHAVGLVHRDFKPDNVVLEDDGKVKVLDFGLARAAYDDAASARVADELAERITEVAADERDRLTQTGALLGTPAYMAPEQYLLQPLDPRTDQFSFCVALFQGVYGYRPFGGRNHAALTLNVIHGRIEAPEDPSVAPPGLLEVLYRGLATNPDDRFASMDQLIDELRALVDTGASRTQASRRRWRLAFAGLGVIALAVGVGLGVQAMREPPPPPPFLSPPPPPESPDTPEVEPPPQVEVRELPVELAAGRGRNLPVAGAQLWIGRDALRLVAADGSARVEVALQAGRFTGAPASERHAIPALIDALEAIRPETAAAAEDPLTLYVDRQTPFETIVAALYSGGRAGFVRYDFAVRSDDATRVFEVKPQVYAARDPALRRRAALELSLGRSRGLSRDQDVVRASARTWAPADLQLDGEPQRWALDVGAGTCELTREPASSLDALARLSAQLCDLNTVSSPVIVSAEADVAWEQVVAVLEAAVPSAECSRGIVIEPQIDAPTDCQRPIAVADLAARLDASAEAGEPQEQTYRRWCFINSRLKSKKVCRSTRAACISEARHWVDKPQKSCRGER